MDYVYNGSIKISGIYYLIAFLIALALWIYFRYRNKSGVRAFAASFMAAYLFLILSTTVISRPVDVNYNYRLILFWSYLEVLRGRTDLLIENLANIVMLVPAGILLPIAKGRMNGRKTVLFGFLFSSGIELLQLFLKRGLFEFDDIVHNTAGCLAGYLIYKLVERLAGIKQ